MPLTERRYGGVVGFLPSAVRWRPAVPDRPCRMMSGPRSRMNVVVSSLFSVSPGSGALAPVRVWMGT